MAEEQVRPGFFGSRAMMRVCLAGVGAALILLGIAMGISDGVAGTGPPRRSATVHPDRTRQRHKHAHGPRHAAATTTTTSRPATGPGGSPPVGASEATAPGSAFPADPTLPVPATSPQPVGAASAPGAPAAQAVPTTTAGAVLVMFIGCGAFGAYRLLRRRRALRRA